jgi:hypothetical protein
MGTEKPFSTCKTDEMERVLTLFTAHMEHAKNEVFGSVLMRMRERVVI